MQERKEVAKVIDIKKIEKDMHDCFKWHLWGYSDEEKRKRAAEYFEHMDFDRAYEFYKQHKKALDSFTLAPAVFWIQEINSLLKSDPQSPKLYKMAKIYCENINDFCVKIYGDVWKLFGDSKKPPMNLNPKFSLESWLPILEKAIINKDGAFANLIFNQCMGDFLYKNNYFAYVKKVKKMFVLAAENDLPEVMDVIYNAVPNPLIYDGTSYANYIPGYTGGYSDQLTTAFSYISKSGSFDNKLFLEAFNAAEKKKASKSTEYLSTHFAKNLKEARLDAASAQASLKVFSPAKVQPATATSQEAKPLKSIRNQ